jgi:hypothetical protein
MKRIGLMVVLVMTAFGFNTQSQVVSQEEKLAEVSDKVEGIAERLATAESDLSKLTKIKVSGYMQAQYQYFESKAVQPTNFFSLRRARVKFAYETTDGVKFVLTPDFAPGSLSIKDAYVVLNDRWTKTLSITAGKFNRPNYEVEYSSSQRELPERSLVIRTLYPGERAIGAKLEYHPVNVPLHVQVALFNGADGLSITNIDKANLNPTENKDYDNYKDVMARVTYNLTLGNFGGLDFGAHGYFGSLKSNAIKTLSSDYETLEDIQVGDALKRTWIGGEFQFFADVLGGLSLKGEYIAGKNASVGYTAVATTPPAAPKPGVANFQNNFAGYYIYFIKNLGKNDQFAFRFDYYDPNTDITGNDVALKGFTSPDGAVLANRMSGKSDLATTTYGLAFHHYFDDNLRVTLGYDIVQNEKTSAAGLVADDYTKADGTKVVKGLDYSKVINQNVMTLRIQAKF